MSLEIKWDLSSPPTPSNLFILPLLQFLFSKEKGNATLQPLSQTNGSLSESLRR